MLAHLKITTATRMYLIKEGFLFLLLLLLTGQSNAEDGCEDDNYWRCGDQCITYWTECKCGTTSFGFNVSQWCCLAEETACEKQDQRP